ncbi:hypothetical protein PHLGIDRAFT_123095 [Phlebiopsis gigantea 11061_1 CR5-6]|uniref:Uncharacterized protein n=1 Tax=Phlebiopsis gigantea (strain 11061_1 CR5-6) TaxID=745531 RepID=A0A0C3RZA1_PHLG1|nr:hypothetical protein PHLGIDRAFT_123095 [Phlebiopsis gigantea 11061_1 CR5-6]
MFVIHGLERVKSCLAYSALTDTLVYIPQIRHLLFSVPIVKWGPDATPVEQQLIVNHAIIKILSLAAQSLITLVVQGPNAFNLVGSNLRFPSLLDLSLPNLIQPQAQDLASSMLPALERLHITHAGGYTQSIRFWELIAKLTPSLTSIRLSSVGDCWLPPFMRILLDVPAHQDRGYVYAIEDEFPPDTVDATRSTKVASQLNRLVLVILQPQIYPSGGRCGTGAIKHGSVVHILQGVARETRDRKIGERQLWMLEESTEYGLEEAVKDWSEIANGKDGPWQLPA